MFAKIMDRIIKENGTHILSKPLVLKGILKDYQAENKDISLTMAILSDHKADFEKFTDKTDDIDIRRLSTAISNDTYISESIVFDRIELLISIKYGLKNTPSKQAKNNNTTKTGTIPVKKNSTVSNSGNQVKNSSSIRIIKTKGKPVFYYDPDDSESLLAYLKSRRCSIDAMRYLNLSAANIRRNKIYFPIEDVITPLIKAGFTEEELRQFGFEAWQFRLAYHKSYHTYNLKGAGYTAKELREAGCSALYVKNCGFSIKMMRRGGYSLAGLKSAHFPISEMLNAFTPESLRIAGYTAKQLREAGCSAKELKEAGYGYPEMIAAYYTEKELAAIGMRHNYEGKKIPGTESYPNNSISDQRDCGKVACDVGGIHSIKDYLAAGYTLMDLMDSGFDKYRLEKEISKNEVEYMDYVFNQLKNNHLSIEETSPIDI